MLRCRSSRGRSYIFSEAPKCQKGYKIEGADIVWAEVSSPSENIHFGEAFPDISISNQGSCVLESN